MIWFSLFPQSVLLHKDVNNLKLKSSDLSHLASTNHFTVYLNLERPSRQIMANHIGPDYHNASDWSTIKHAVPGIVCSS